MAATTGSRGVVWMPPERPAPVTKSRYFCRAQQRSVRGLRDRSGEPLKTWRGLALLEPLASRFFFTLRLPQASSTQSRRRRTIITGRCPQAAPDAPRATRAAAARSSTHRCTSPHPALQRRDSCRRRSNSARCTRRSPSPRLLTAPPSPPATKQTQRNRHRRNHAGS
jgi:hypothetical protein